tara:strand:- start:44 stop:325 length:282 start_codon:yes stop_codon:yes gene_type:complete
MKIYIEGKGIQVLPTKQAEALKARQSPTASWRLEALRMQRNKLLAETDYMANSDATMSNAWKKYRQDLRDITKTFKSMSDKNFKFPTKPTDTE